MSRTGHIVENPAQFESAEIGAQWQAGLTPKPVLSTSPREFSDIISNTRVLPDQRVSHRFAGLSGPNNRRLPLISDPDRRQVSRLERLLLHRLGDHLLCSLPDLISIMFYPSWLRIDLLMIFLGSAYGPPCAIKDDEACAGGALIDCSDIAAQACLPQRSVRNKNLDMANAVYITSPINGPNIPLQT